jgi:hypothetical protein
MADREAARAQREEAREQTATLRAQRELAEEQERAARRSLRGRATAGARAAGGAAARRAARRIGKSPLKDIVDYAEIAGIVALLWALRKPIVRATKWIEDKIRNHAEKAESEWRTKEQAARKAVVDTYLKDPVFARKIGGEMYTQLVVNGKWDEQYYRLTDPPPAAMAAQFSVGSGKGRVSVTAEIVHMFAEEAELFFRWLIERGTI